MIDVPNVESELLLPGEGVTSVDLGPAGDAGLDVVTPRLLRRVTVEVLHEEGSRADEAHVSLENVEERGQLVDAGGAKEATDRRQALGVGLEGVFAGLGGAHRPELGQVERLAVEAGSQLAEEDGAAEGEVDGDGGAQEEGRGRRERDRGEGEVEETHGSMGLYGDYPKRDVSGGGDGGFTN